MDIRFTEKCKFIFPQIQTTEDQVGYFAIGVIVVFILSVLGQIFPTKLSKIFNKQEENKLKEPVIYFFDIINMVMTMFFLMTMNGYVIVSTILGQIFGYLFFSSQKEEKLQSLHESSSEHF